MKKSIVVGATALTIGAGSLVGLSAVGAMHGPNGDLAEKLAAEFNLNQAEVEDFLQNNWEENMAERQAERQAQRQEQLDQLVSEGKLTQSQADELAAIEATHRQDIEDLHDSEDFNRETMKELRDSFREEIKAWADDNDVDLDDIRPPKGERGESHDHQENGSRRQGI